VQHRDLTEPDQQLRIGANGVERQPIGDPIGPLAAACGDDRPHPPIAQRVVEVGEAVLVAPGEVAPGVEGVRCDLDDETERRQVAAGMLDGGPLGSAGR
jgi:hypothetical protein